MASPLQALVRCGEIKDALFNYRFARLTTLTPTDFPRAFSRRAAANSVR